MPAHVFLSYSHANGTCVTKLQHILENAGLSVWRDISDIRTGDYFSRIIPAAIKSVGCVILVLSRNSENSENVKEEIDIALQSHVPILPILIDAQSPNDLHDDWWKERLRHIRCEIALGCALEPISARLVEAARFHSHRRCPVIGVFHMKGGVGKTITAAQLAARLNVFYQRKVLLIDLDPQQNLTDFLFLVNQLKDCLGIHNSVIGSFEPTKIGYHESLYDDFACDVTQAIETGNFVTPYSLHNGLGIDLAFDCIPGDMRAIKYSNQNQKSGEYSGK